MSALNFIKENYKRVIAVTILAIITSVITCFFLWPDATPVMADNTDTYGLVQELVREEVENYIAEKKDILTQDDVAELKKRVDDVLDQNGLIMKTIFQSKELEKIITECIEKNIAGDREAADSTAKKVMLLLERIEENDKAHQELVSSYNSYREEMAENLRILKEEAEHLMNEKADKETTSKELEQLQKELDKVSELSDKFDKEAEKRMSELDKEILSNKADFDTFVKNYNEYKISINEILETKATKDDLKALSEKAAALEESLRKAIAENEKAIAENGKAIEENGRAISENENAIAENGKAISENGKAIEEHGKAISENENAISENGNAISENGKAISENGKAISENGKAISENGNAISENGRAISANERAISQNRDSIISINNSLSGKRLWVGSQAEYNAIGTKDPNTLYFIR